MSVTKSLFISTDYFKEVTALNQNVDDVQVRAIILSSQRLYIEPVIGTDLFNAIVTKIQASSLTGDYQTLTNSWIAPALTWWSMVELVPNLAVDMSRGGVYRSQAENSSTATIQELNYLTGKYRARAEHFTNRLVDYLCSNSNLFPEYSTNSDEDLRPSRDKQYNSIWLGDTSETEYEKRTGQRY